MPAPGSIVSFGESAPISLPWSVTRVASDRR